MKALAHTLAIVGVLAAVEVMAAVRVRELAERGEANRIELRGLTASPLPPVAWEAGRLHWVPEIRRPLITPRDGKYRNIYAPSVVQLEKGWRIFFGGWDGTPTGNDQVYSVDTSDFLRFENRRTVIEHGVFRHVCNVNVQRTPIGEFDMICTVYPDGFGRNKPAWFSSVDGEKWNRRVPYPAQLADLIRVRGYPRYDEADINGVSVLVRESGAYRLYFSDFRDFGKIFRASGDSPRALELERSVLDERLQVNDVKKFLDVETNWYLMGLHANTERLWYSVSRDGLKFSPSRVLFEHRDAVDAYIVSIGFVCNRSKGELGRAVLGVLYGAGHDKHLMDNRIFAMWLQKRVVLVNRDRRVQGAEAIGPDRQIIASEPNAKLEGKLELYEADGETLMGTAERVTMWAGRVYEVIYQR